MYVFKCVTMLIMIGSVAIEDARFTIGTYTLRRLINFHQKRGFFVINFHGNIINKLSRARTYNKPNKQTT